MPTDDKTANLNPKLQPTGPSLPNPKGTWEDNVLALVQSISDLSARLDTDMSSVQSQVRGISQTVSGIQTALNRLQR